MKRKRHRGLLALLTAAVLFCGSVPVSAGKAPSQVLLYRDTYAYQFLTPGQQYTMLVRTSPHVPPQLSSSDPQIVQTVDAVWNEGSRGYLCVLRAGEKAGEAQVTVTAGDAAVTMPVTLKLSSAAILPDTSAYDFVYCGQTYLMRTYTPAEMPLVVSSADPQVVSVQTTGGQGCYYTKITALAAGKTNVILRAGSSTAFVPVTASFVPLNVTAQLTNCRLSGVGQTCDIVFHTPKNLAPTAYTSANWYIASVHSLGWNREQGGYVCRVTATGTGAASVTAWLGSGNSCTVPVTVNSPMQAVSADMTRRAQMYSSSTGYLLLVDIGRHRVGTYAGKQGNWREVQNWPCGNGAPATPTVLGSFCVGTRGYCFDSEGARCFYYTQISGPYLFHSVLYAQTSTPTRVVDGRVGASVSHGCVRLELQNAKWIYDYIPADTRVIIY